MPCIGIGRMLRFRYASQLRMTDPRQIRRNEMHRREIAEIRRDYAKFRELIQNSFDEQERHIAKLEKRNRKLNDKLNRYRNVLPGRKRLITLGRIAAMMEAEADFAERDPKPPHVVPIDWRGLRADALFLRRLEWDFEQAIDVVHPSEQPRHQWPRP